MFFSTSEQTLTDVAKRLAESLQHIREALNESDKQDSQKTRTADEAV